MPIAAKLHSSHFLHQPSLNEKKEQKHEKNFVAAAAVDGDVDDDDFAVAVVVVIVAFVVATSVDVVAGVPAA